MPSQKRGTATAAVGALTAADHQTCLLLVPTQIESTLPLCLPLPTCFKPLLPPAYRSGAAT
jgi:hypothetical protein